MNRQTISLFIAIIALAASAYIWIRYSRTVPPRIADITEESDKEVERLLAEVKRLREIRLDTSIFQDRLFQKLKESPAPPEAATTPGRTNPFAPF